MLRILSFDLCVCSAASVVSERTLGVGLGRLEGRVEAHGPQEEGQRRPGRRAEPELPLRGSIRHALGPMAKGKAKAAAAKATGKAKPAAKAKGKAKPAAKGKAKAKAAPKGRPKARALVPIEDRRGRE